MSGNNDENKIERTETDAEEHSRVSPNENVRAMGEEGERETDAQGENGYDECGDKEDRGKRNAVTWFFTTRAALIVALVGLIVPVAALIFAVLLGGTVFDKAAIIWACAFVVQMLYRMRISHKTRDLVLAVVFGIAALAFIVLYILELTGIIP